MEARDVERIAKTVLREIGAGDPPVTIAATGPDAWNVVLGGDAPATLKIRAGAGTTAQYIRQQIFDQLTGR
ncbi:MAG: hypothetical protein ACRD1V_07900 [Vicinamibacterales bacterium]